MKKLISVLLAATMLIAFTSCKNNEETKTEAETTEYTTKYTTEYTTPTYSETTTESFSETVRETESTSTVTATSEIVTETTVRETDPSKWSDEEIIDFYKAAASKSHGKTKSVQKMTLEELSVNDGDGALGNVVEFVTPFFVSALEKNSTEIDGITGGYKNLTASDAASIKAYKEGNYTVIEMTMKEQTDGIHADAQSGTVGHAISVVGDISVVEKELPQFEIGFEDAEISLRYANPKVKVKINKDGIIEKGEWSYTVCVNVANLRIKLKSPPIGITADKGYGEVGYIITVG